MKKLLTTAAGLTAATSLIGIAAVTWSVPAHASTQTIVGQGAYLCQSAPKGLPMKTYDVTMRMSLTAPTSVAPGQTVSLSGTLTLQFPESAYQEGKRYGVSEVDGYSDTMSVGTTLNGKTTDVLANRWQTAPFAWSDPVVVTAPVTLHAFTVPASASGSLTITLPRNERRAPNLASDSPATVAFNGVATDKTMAGPVAENLGCYLQGTAPSVIATIPISAAADPTPPGGESGQEPAGSPSPMATEAGDASPQATTAPGSTKPGAPAADAPAGSPPVGAAPVGADGTIAPALSPQSGFTAAPEPRSGVFISTTLMIVVGGLICLAALAYSMLAQYRLRSIKRAMDG